MLDNLINWIGSLGNRRGSTLSIPIFDGPFKPNKLLDDAEVLVEHPELRDMALSKDGQLFVAYGASAGVVKADGKIEDVFSFDADITALTVLKNGQLVVALDNKVIIAPGTKDEATLTDLAGQKLNAVTALYQKEDGDLLICDASKNYGCNDWAWDLMSKRADGRLISVDISTLESREIANNLSYAFGVIDSPDTGMLISESWSHSVARATNDGIKQVIDRLPGYPCRMAPAEDGGFWLSLFSSRTQLVEFVLNEDDYRQEMMATIDPAYWISPSFGSGKDFLEPLQGGGVKQMGILKPWAPPRSYGFLVRYDSEFIPQYSLHSRVDGENHGICAVAQDGDKLFALSRGSGRVLKLSIEQIEATILGGK